jgi:hypothetical protein
MVSGFFKSLIRVAISEEPESDGISLHGLNIASVQFKLIGNAGMP